MRASILVERISIIARNSDKKPVLDDNSVLKSFSTFIFFWVYSSCCLRNPSRVILLASTCFTRGFAIGVVETVV